MSHDAVFVAPEHTVPFENEGVRVLDAGAVEEMFRVRLFRVTPTPAVVP